MVIWNATHHADLVKYATEHEPLNSLFLGTEVEIDGVDSIVRRCSRQELADKFDVAAAPINLKNDGSLENDGIEIVSQPCTLKYHMSKVSWKWIFKLASKNGWRSHDTETCGLHVHVGRQELGADEAERAETTLKMVVLMYRFWDEFVKFSRRKDLGELERWARRPDISCWYRARLTGYQLAIKSRESIPVYDHVDEEHYHPCRYQAVNRHNKDTVEIRIFKGTLNRDTYIATLQLVNNYATFARESTWDTIQSCTWLDMARNQAYNELDAYLINRGLMNASLAVSTGSRRVPELTGVDCPEALAV